MLCSGVSTALGPPISVCTHPGLNISTLIPCGSTSFARIDIAMFNAALLDLYWYADPNPIVAPKVCSEPIPVLIATICFRLLAATFSISASATRTAPRTFVSNDSRQPAKFNSPSLFPSRVKMAEFKISKSTGLPFSTSAKCFTESSLVTSSACRDALLPFANRSNSSLCFGFRAVAITSHPSAEYCRTNSNPSPRLAPVIKTVDMASLLLCLRKISQVCCEYLFERSLRRMPPAPFCYSRTLPATIPSPQSPPISEPLLLRPIPKREEDGVDKREADKLNLSSSPR